ncbi:MAG: cupin domain-containing protein [Candidatus Caenarcaniphilales bacterium]|nr:cupin domain-containing protein [Candidatus Caenarcaniphilales bacterium]
MKIYELENLNPLTNSQLKEETGVIASSDIDLREVMNLVSSGQYNSFDEVTINENTPDETLGKFAKEHSHSDEEVRYFLSGQSIFDVRSYKDHWIRIEVEDKDFITIPANLFHRFFTPDKNVKALRLFSGKEGWVPNYREDTKDVSAV